MVGTGKQGVVGVDARGPVHQVKVGQQRGPGQGQGPVGREVGEIQEILVQEGLGVVGGNPEAAPFRSGACQHLQRAGEGRGVHLPGGRREPALLVQGQVQGGPEEEQPAAATARGQAKEQPPGDEGGQAEKGQAPGQDVHFRRRDQMPHQEGGTGQAQRGRGGQAGPVQPPARRPGNARRGLRSQHGQSEHGPQVPAGGGLEGIKGGDVAVQPGIKGGKTAQGEEIGRHQHPQPKGAVPKTPLQGRVQGQEQRQHPHVHRIFPGRGVAPGVVPGGMAEHAGVEEVQVVPGPEGILQREGFVLQALASLGKQGVLPGGRELARGQGQRDQAREPGPAQEAAVPPPTKAPGGPQPGQEQGVPRGLGVAAEEQQGHDAGPEPGGAGAGSGHQAVGGPQHPGGPGHGRVHAEEDPGPGHGIAGEGEDQPAQPRGQTRKAGVVIFGGMRLLKKANHAPGGPEPMAHQHPAVGVGQPFQPCQGRGQEEEPGGRVQHRGLVIGEKGGAQACVGIPPGEMALDDLPPGQPAPGDELKVRRAPKQGVPGPEHGPGQGQGHQEQGQSGVAKQATDVRHNANSPMRWDNCIVARIGRGTKIRRRRSADGRQLFSAVRCPRKIEKSGGIGPWTGCLLCRTPSLLSYFAEESA